MIVNGKRLLNAAPIVDMLGTKETNGIVSRGLGRPEDAYALLNRG